MNLEKTLSRVGMLSIVAGSIFTVSCAPTNSQNPMGDGFTRAGDAIGRVVNGVVPNQQPRPQVQPQYRQAPQPKYQAQPQQYQPQQYKPQQY